MHPNHCEDTNGAKCGLDDWRGTGGTLRETKSFDGRIQRGKSAVPVLSVAGTW